MRIAIIGGTGASGRALAERIHALGEEVDRPARPVARNRDRGCHRRRGASNEKSVDGADLVVLAVRSNAALATARGLAPVLGTTRSSARRQRPHVHRPRSSPRPAVVLARRAHRPDRRGARGRGPPDTGGGAPDTGGATGRGRARLRRRPAREGSVAGARRPPRHRPSDRRRPLGERSRAGGDDGGDPQRQPPLPGARRDQASSASRDDHGSPVEGIPEVRAETTSPR